MSGIISGNNVQESVVAGRIDGTGTASITSGRGFALTDDGAGDYTLTFNRPYDALVAVVATSLTTDVVMTVGTISVAADGVIGSTIQFKAEAIDETAADVDADFSFVTVWEVDV